MSSSVARICSSALHALLVDWWTKLGLSGAFESDFEDWVYHLAMQLWTSGFTFLSLSSLAVKRSD